MTRRVRPFLIDQAASVLPLAALFLPAMLLVIALGLEFSRVHLARAQLQVAADAAALAGAKSLPDTAAAQLQAQALASANTTSGVGPSVLAPADVTFGQWSSGTFTPNATPANAVRVVTRRATANGNALPTILGGVIGFTEFQLARTAIATNAGGQQACMLALHPTAPGAVTFIGNPTALLTGCVVASNSTSSSAILVAGSATVTAPCIVSVGGAEIRASLVLTECSTPTTGRPPAPDPFAALPEPPIPSTCRSVPSGGGSISPGRYCSMNFRPNRTYNLQPGVYVVDGTQLQINNNTVVNGAGVTFFLTNGATVQMNGTATVNLSAPTSGTYSGILMYGDRDQGPATNIFNGTAASRMTGTLYFPTQSVQYNGNFSGVNRCLQIVSLTIEMRGNPDLNSNCALSGVPPVLLPGSLRLVA